MEADKSFVRKLKEISKQLYIEWEPVQKRFRILYHGSDGGHYVVHTIQNSDLSFRQPDDRDITMLRRCDMSNKVHDPAYYADQQYQQMKEQKALARKKHLEEQQYKARQLGTKWQHAVQNAEKGIYRDSQLDNKTIYSLPSTQYVTYRKTSKELINKLGKPHLTGEVKELNPTKGDNYGRFNIIQPN